MFFFKNIGIWYLLLSLVRTRQLCSSLEDSKAIPFYSENAHIQEETQYLPHHSQNIEDYPNGREYIPVKHAVREIQEYEDDYREDGDSQNAYKGRLGLFSWWNPTKKNTGCSSVTATICPPVTETAWPSNTENNRSPAIESTFPPLEEPTCLPETENNRSPAREPTFPTVKETTCPPEIENYRSPIILSTFPPLKETTGPRETGNNRSPVIDSTFPPVKETTCPPETGNNRSPVIESTFPPVNETTGHPEPENNRSPVIESTFPTAEKITGPPETENNRSSVIEPTCPTFIETDCPPPDIETTCFPDIVTAWPSDKEITCPPNSEAKYPLDIETTVLPANETTCAIDAPTIGSTKISSDAFGADTADLTTNCADTIGSTTIGADVPNFIRNGSGIISSTKNGPNIIGSIKNVPDKIGSTQNGDCTIYFCTNCPGTNDTTSDGPATIGSTINGQDTIDSSPDHCCTRSAFTTVDCITDDPATIDSTLGLYKIDSSSNDAGTSAFTTNCPGTIDSITNGSDTIDATINGHDTIDSSTNNSDTSAFTTNCPGTMDSITNGPGTINYTINGHDKIDSSTNNSGTSAYTTNCPGTLVSNTNGPGTTIRSYNTGPVSTTIRENIIVSTTDDPGESASTTNRPGTDPKIENDTPSTVNADAAGSTTADGFEANSTIIDSTSITNTMDEYTTDESADIRITVDPAAISTDPDYPDPVTGTTDISTTTTSSQSTSSASSSTAGYITACYTITLDCSPITIGTPVICDSDIDSVTVSTATPNGYTTTTGSTGSTASTVVTVDYGDVEDNAASTVASSSDRNSTGTRTSTATSPGLTGCSSGQNLTTGMSVPPALKMFGAGMFLPVYQVPLTPFMPSPTAPPNLPKKSQLMTNSVLTKLRLKNISSFHDHHRMLFKNLIQVNNRIMLDEKSPVDTVSNHIKDNIMAVNETKKIIDQIDSTNNLLHNRLTGIINKPSSLNSKISQNLKKEVLKTLTKQTFIYPFEKYRGHQPKKLSEILTPLKNERERLLAQNRNSEELLKGSENIFRHRLKLYDYFNPLCTIPPQLSKTVPNILTENYAALKNITPTIENRGVSDMKNFYSEFVKYNDTYLFENSNTSVNLVDLCKNVTCQGNNYLSQCCSRVFGTEKCEGEDFSYLHPIPGDTTTVTTTAKGLDRSVGVNATYPTVKFNNYTQSCQCSSRQKSSRVARENDMNDFVKFQLMHGLTNPDGKKMINALKEVNLEVQKVNREFHSNNPPNVLQMNTHEQSGNLPMIDNHSLFKKEQEGVVLPFSSNKVLDDFKTKASNSLLQSNLKPFPFQKDRYRFIRNQGLQDQIDCFRENNMILEKLKKETEIELKRLCLLETKRREEELLFEKERENQLKELKTIQDLIHREFDSRLQGYSVKRAISDTVQKLIKQTEPTKKESKYTKLVKNIENSARNDDLDNLFLNRYSSIDANASNSVSVEKFPELEIKNSASNPHDNALLVLNIESDKENISDEYRKRREGYNDSQNKILMENI